MPILKIPYVSEDRLVPNYFLEALHDGHEFGRNICSIPKGVISPFFTNIEIVQKSIDFERKNPFNDETMTFDDGFRCEDNLSRYMHIDYGQKVNATGISMLKVPDFKKVIIRDSDVETEVSLPFFEFDFVGKVYAPKGGEILLPDIRELIIYELARRGFNLKLISYDGFGSIETIQILVSEGYASDRLSIDRTTSRLIYDPGKPNRVKRVTTSGNFTAAWMALKEAFLDERIKLPYHPAFEDEIKHAEKRIKGSKVTIDSPSSSLSLDLLESMAGSVFNALNNEREDILTDDDIANERDWDGLNFYKNFGRDGTDPGYSQFETDTFYNALNRNKGDKEWD